MALFANIQDERIAEEEWNQIPRPPAALFQLGWHPVIQLAFLSFLSFLAKTAFSLSFPFSTPRGEAVSCLSVSGKRAMLMQIDYSVGAIFHWKGRSEPQFYNIIIIPILQMGRRGLRLRERGLAKATGMSLWQK